MSVREHISGAAGSIVTKFCVRIPVSVAGSCSGGVAICCVLPGFMDYVTFGRNGPYGSAWTAAPQPTTVAISK